MQTYFGYGIFENSLVFMAGGVEALIIFFSMAYISRHVRDTTLLIIGWMLMIIAQAWLMVAILYFQEGMEHIGNVVMHKSNG